jgi:nickel/cobalt transporter (NiCoT) family protein
LTREPGDLPSLVQPISGEVTDDLSLLRHHPRSCCFSSAACEGVMSGIVSNVLNKSGAGVRRRLIAIYAILIGGNILIWLWALVALGDQPILLGTALLAYTFGLRHAVDADHIAAIDNVTRKLMQQGQRPVGVGFFFSLGHSAVVVLLSVGVAFAASEITSRFDSLKAVGGIIGTSASALFLFAIALINVLVLISVYRTFQAVKRGEPFAEDDFDILLNRRGFLSRIFRPLFRLVTESWHMLAIGFLFGLGFDTATEVALFGISSAQAANGMSFSAIMVFPALFTAGMSLVDTTDGVLMLGAYGWAFLKPIRKLYYNMTITAVSVVVAVLIGGLETLNLVGDQLGLTDGGGFWGAIGEINDNFGLLGYAVIGIFLLSWIGSVVFYKLMRYDDIETSAVWASRR